MTTLFGAAIGLALGWIAWLVSQHFAAQYQAVAATPPGTKHLEPREDGGGVASVAVLVQTLTALWGAYVGWQVASLAAGALALVVTSLLLCIALVDFQVRRIPNLLVGALLVCAVLQALLLSAPTVPSMVLGLLVGGGAFLLLAIIGRGAMGMGDVKLAAAIGALLGLPAALQGLFVGILCGGLAAAILLLTKRVGRKDPMAYGPWLALGAWVVLVHAWGLWPGQ